MERHYRTRTQQAACQQKLQNLIVRIVKYPVRQHLRIVKVWCEDAFGQVKTPAQKLLNGGIIRKRTECPPVYKAAARSPFVIKTQQCFGSAQIALEIYKRKIIDG